MDLHPTAEYQLYAASSPSYKSPKKLVREQKTMYMHTACQTVEERLPLDMESLSIQGNENFPGQVEMKEYSKYSRYSQLQKSPTKNIMSNQESCETRRIEGTRHFKIFDSATKRYLCEGTTTKNNLALSGSASSSRHAQSHVYYNLTPTGEKNEYKSIKSMSEQKNTSESRNSHSNGTKQSSPSQNCSGTSKSKKVKEIITNVNSSKQKSSSGMRNNLESPLLKSPIPKITVQESKNQSNSGLNNFSMWLSQPDLSNSGSASISISPMKKECKSKSITEVAEQMIKEIHSLGTAGMSRQISKIKEENGMVEEDRWSKESAKSRKSLSSSKIESNELYLYEEEREFKGAYISSGDEYESSTDGYAIRSYSYRKHEQRCERSFEYYETCSSNGDESCDRHNDYGSDSS